MSEPLPPTKEENEELGYSGESDDDGEFEEYDFDDKHGMHSISQSFHGQRDGTSFRDTSFSHGGDHRHVMFSHEGESNYGGYSSYSTSYKPDVSVPGEDSRAPSERSRLIRGPRKVSVPYDRKRTTTGSFSHGQSAFMSSMYKLQNTFSVTAQAIGRMNSALASQRTMAYTWSFANIPSFDRSASTALTFFNALAMIQGISMLAIPFITARGGLSTVILILLLGVLSWYGAILLLECQYQTSTKVPGQLKRVSASYIEIGAKAFPKFGETVLKIFTISGIVTDIYCFVLLGQMTTDLFRNESPLTSQQWILIWAVLSLPTFFITKVSVLSWLGFTSLVSYTIALVASYVYLFCRYSSWSLDNIPLTPSIQYITISYGVILNSYNFHQSVPALEGSMAKPASCKKMLTAAFTVNTAMKALFGVTGALTFGLLVDQSVTRNFSSSLAVSLLVNALTAINLFFNFPMSLFVVFEMMDRYTAPHFKIFKKGHTSFWGWIILSRLVVVVLVVFVAVTVSQFGMIVSFIGNIRGTLVTVIFPVSFYLSLRWRHLSKFSVGAHISLMVLCSVVGIGGAYYSIMGIAVGV